MARRTMKMWICLEVRRKEPRRVAVGFVESRGNGACFVDLTDFVEHTFFTS